MKQYRGCLWQPLINRWKLPAMYSTYHLPAVYITYHLPAICSIYHLHTCYVQYIPPTCCVHYISPTCYMQYIPPTCCVQFISPTCYMKYIPPTYLVCTAHTTYLLCTYSTIDNRRVGIGNTSNRMWIKCVPGSNALSARIFLSKTNFIHCALRPYNDILMHRSQIFWFTCVKFWVSLDFKPC